MERFMPDRQFPDFTRDPLGAIGALAGEGAQRFGTQLGDAITASFGPQPAREWTCTKEGCGAQLRTILNPDAAHKLATSDGYSASCPDCGIVYDITLSITARN
jgi:hypothetical protein